MKLYQIKRRVEIAIEMLRVNDNYLLKNDVNERSITHKLAMYLDQTFGKEYDVDCEYNRNIDDSRNRKMIDIIISEVESTTQSVYPDIIVHKRGRNDANLLVIEVKKSTNRDNGDFDIKKLECYTDSSSSSSFTYTYGVFIKLFASEEKYIKPEVLYFKNGKRIS
ncbi:hypothetical protein QE109_02235 [Fusibacter bizertensis]|uniref:Type I restriction enzyme R protein N-terminal domain-containing protein n=1 Tax=Fusibacter bizertensis TaxID=1488331 RepID=A0ABT6N950_9FIRM|nr:hypothetical protein [Fusibacter bizertensis]MDH8676945.1 hypothetical protein [Fusibacter bizertensis]